MTIPDPGSGGILGILASLGAAAVGYYKYIKVQPTRTWQQEDCEEAIRKAIRALSLEQDQKLDSVRESLDLMSADHAKRLGHLEADARSVMRFRSEVEDRLAWLESARRAPPKPTPNT